MGAGIATSLLNLSSRVHVGPAASSGWDIKFSPTPTPGTTPSPTLDATGLYSSGKPFPENPAEVTATAAILSNPVTAGIAAFGIGAAIGYFGPWDPWGRTQAGPPPTPPTPAPLESPNVIPFPQSEPSPSPGGTCGPGNPADVIRICKLHYAAPNAAFCQYLCPPFNSEGRGGMLASGRPVAGRCRSIIPESEAEKW